MDSQETSEPSRQDRVIRVFISSTFRDMHEERELLVKQVFPDLRRICAERFVTFTEVDLRWGITEEQAAEGKVLPLCLEEIHRCRPFFIGLLGERYGWIPETMPQEVMDREPWLKEHVGSRTSVTELEILHGVLNDSAMAGRSFFYFRDPAYVDSIPVKDRADFLPESPNDKEKLKNLKERILKSGLPVLENYPDPKALAEAIRDQFIDLIDQIYPKDTTPDPLDQEASGHETHARGKLLAFVERPPHTKALNDFVNKEPTGQGIVVTGESGCGKTALLAAWVQEWKKNNPEDFIFQHYFGATLESASVDGFLRRLLGEFKRQYEIAEDIPLEPDKLREALPHWLAQTVGKSRIILVLDGLNQIEGNEPDQGLAFLPRHFPPHVRVIASTLPGPAFDSLEKQGWTVYTLPLCDINERNQMIQAFLDHYGKTLRPDLKDRIAAAPGTANPLFLHTVLEELRQFGSFESLPDRVAYYLEARSPVELFRRVLRRWQEDFNDNQDLVSRTLNLLWSARQGLEETEWLELLGIPRQVWSPLFLAMESHLTRRAGLYAFGHDFLRKAVKEEFLSSTEDQRTTHLLLADYFEGQQGMSNRKAAEWPWQLRSAEEWNRLEACLTNLELFVTLFNEKTKWELVSHWLPLRKRGMNMGESYKKAFDRWMQKDPVKINNAYFHNDVGILLSDNGLYAESENFLKYAVECRERIYGNNDHATIRSKVNLAVILYRNGKYKQAESLCSETFEISKRVLGEVSYDTLNCGNLLAIILEQKRDYKAAEPLLRWIYKNCERVLGSKNPLTLAALNNLGWLLYSKGDIDEAEIVMFQTLERMESFWGKLHFETLDCVLKLSVLLRSKKDYEQAELLNRRAFEGYEKLAGNKHFLTLLSVINLANLYYEKGDYEQSEPLYYRALEGYKEVRGKYHADTREVEAGLAKVLFDKKDYSKAKPLLHRVYWYNIVFGDGSARDLLDIADKYDLCCKAMGLTDDSVYHIEAERLEWVEPEFRLYLETMGQANEEINEDAIEYAQDHGINIRGDHVKIDSQLMKSQELGGNPGKVIPFTRKMK